MKDVKKNLYTILGLTTPKRGGGRSAYAKNNAIARKLKAIVEVLYAKSFKK